MGVHDTGHDAEEALRPYLERIRDTEETIGTTEIGTAEHEVALVRFAEALENGLDKALELLGVQR